MALAPTASRSLSMIDFFRPSSRLIVFSRWLGQNSKQNKLQRQLGDLQIRMRLKVLGDKAEIRQSYIPSLFPHVVHPLMETGAVNFFFLSLLERV
jgi:hypothetical protein